MLSLIFVLKGNKEYYKRKWLLDNYVKISGLYCRLREIIFGDMVLNLFKLFF